MDCRYSKEIELLCMTCLMDPHPISCESVALPCNRKLEEVGRTYYVGL